MTLWTDRTLQGREVVVAHFVRWSQTCGEATNLRTQDDDGAVRAVCDHHAEVLGARDAS